jgi:hypothetical protein
MGPANPRYEVIYSGAQRDLLRGLRRIARTENLNDVFVNALAMHHRQLERSPLTWGVPCGRLETLQLSLFYRVYSILLVEYAVDETRRLVYPKTFQLLPGYPPEAN